MEKLGPIDIDIEPVGDITGSVTSSTIKAGSITINTYEYQTVGKALEAY
jgi:hypothetical protein